MKKVYLLLCMFVLTSTSFAQSSDGIVTWHSIEGVIATQQDTNPVSPNINSGTFAWTTRSGQARVNLFTGSVAFDVRGLVINGTSFSGTPGPVSEVEGTVVCGAGTTQEQTFDTTPVELNSRGNARFSGHVNIALPCINPLFLIRITTPAGALGRWIATGAERVFGDRFDDQEN